MVTFLDKIAYRLLARGCQGKPSMYTPEFHYRCRAHILETRPDIFPYSGTRLPYCVMLVRDRLVDLGWSVRYFLGI